MVTKFSNIEKDGPKKSNDNVELKFQGDYIKVITYKDYEIVSESDMVIVLPYLRDEGCVLLRHEYIPTYQYFYKDTIEYKNINNFLTVISGSVEKGESVENTLRRELYEEAGIVLSNMYKVEFIKHLFSTKGNVSRYHICLLELNYNDYKIVQSTGDGSKSEKLSKTIKVDISDLNEIKSHDLITEYLLTKFKLEYNIK